MGSKSYRLQVRVFALGLISLVVLGFNFRGFQTWMNSESNKLSTDSTSALVESNEPPSERLTRPATNSAVELSSPPQWTPKRAAVNDTRTDSSVLHNRENDRVADVTGDISFLLDFAIIAHPKTATTFLGDYLNRSEGIYIHSEEHCFMKPDKVADFVTNHLPLYKRWRKEGKDVKIGIKCPGRQCVKSSGTMSTDRNCFQGCSIGILTWRTSTDTSPTRS